MDIQKMIDEAIKDLDTDIKTDENEGKLETSDNTIDFDSLKEGLNKSAESKKPSAFDADLFFKEPLGK